MEKGRNEINYFYVAFSQNFGIILIDRVKIKGENEMKVLKSHKSWIVIFIAIFILYNQESFAEETLPPIEDLIEDVSEEEIVEVDEDDETDIVLSLSDLLNLNLNVSLASKSMVSIRKTPGIIRVFTEEDIKYFGFRTLKDILIHVPGFQLNKAKQDHTNIFIRGVQGRTTSKILFMIDGVPMRDLYWGNFMIDEMVSLKNISRIEILSGPGSVMYGANAFAGIISITTKSYGNSISGGYGQIKSYDNGDKDNNKEFKNLSLEASHKGFYGFADIFDSEGFRPKRGIEGDIYDHEQKKEKKHFSLKYKNDSFTFVSSITEYKNPYILTKDERIRYFTRTPFYLMSEYIADLTDDFSMTFQGFYNHYNFKREDEYLDKKTFRTGYRNGALWGGEIISNLQMDSHSITSGVSFLREKINKMENDKFSFKTNTREKTLLLLEENPERDDIGIYIQDIWDLNDNLALTSGVRYSILSDFDNQLTYRLALTGEYGSFYSKLLYGTAFRVPTYREYYKKFNPNLPVGDVQPEYMTTIEAQFGYVFEKADINFTLFRNSYKDFIKEINTVSVNGEWLDPDDPGKADLYSYNLDEIRTWGVEFSSTYVPVENLYFRLATSAILGAEEDPGDAPSNTVLENSWDSETNDLNYLSKYMISLLVAYQINDTYRLSVDSVYNSSVKESDDYLSNLNINESDIDSNLDSYILVNLNLNINLNKKLSMDVKVNNLFDKDIYHPNFSDPTEYNIENPGRSVAIYLKYEF